MKYKKVALFCFLALATWSCHLDKSTDDSKSQPVGKETKETFSLTTSVVLIGTVEKYRVNIGEAIGHRLLFSIQECVKGKLPIRKIRFTGMNDNLGSDKLMKFEKRNSPTYGDLEIGAKYYLGLEPFMIPKEFRLLLDAGKSTEI